MRHTTNPTSILGVAVILSVAGACAPESGPADGGTWVGSVTTDGNVTTVVNESGSVWGGTATLVEEASIGVEVGEEPYMLGRIESLWADDGKIFVLDRSVPVVRVYDFDGNYLHDVGREGQGPGEYERPYFIGGDDADRLFLFDAAAGRISLFSYDGEYLEGWQTGPTNCCGYPMVVTREGIPHLPVRDPEAWQISEMAMSMRAFGPDGAYGPLLQTPDLRVPDHTFRFGDRTPAAKFAPTVTWTLATDGSIVTGASHEYRFEIRHPDGQIVVVEREYEPVPVDPEERDWWRRYFIAIFRRGQEGWTWNGAEMPDVKPAFTGFWPTAGGDIWVIRPGPGRRLPQCDPNADVGDHDAFQAAACWGETEMVDVFDPEGKFLGPLDVPQEINLRFAMPWVSGDTVVASSYDEDGVIRVRRYRIAPPREE